MKSYLASGGSAQPILNKRYFSELRIHVPLIARQRAIAHILGTLDDKIELNRRMNETLEEMARAIFKSWFVDFDPVRAKAEGCQPYGMDADTAALFPDSFQDSSLGSIPKGWTSEKLGTVATINDNGIKKDYPHETIEYVDISSVSVGRLNGTTQYSLTEAPSRAKRLVTHGDTIWSCVRPNRKSYYFVTQPRENLVVSTGFAVISPSRVGASFLYSWLTTDEFVEYLSYNADGSAYPAVRVDRFEDADLVLPSDRILEHFEHIAGPLRDTIANNEEESRTLASLRDTLLPKLLSGEIRVKDAEKFVEEANGNQKGVEELEAIGRSKRNDGQSLTISRRSETAEGLEEIDGRLVPGQPDELASEGVGPANDSDGMAKSTLEDFQARSKSWPFFETSPWREGMWIPPDPSWSEYGLVAEYALTMDGYSFADEYWGATSTDAMERLEEFETNGAWQGTFEELRCCLFLMQRSLRHQEGGPFEHKNLYDPIFPLFQAVCNAWEARSSYSKAPDSLDFGEGGYWPPSARVRIKKGRMQVERWLGKEPQEVSETKEKSPFDPGDARWLEFSFDMDRLGVWKWKRSYVEPGVVDGTSWHFELKWNGRKVKSGGSNAFPETYGGLREALDRLMGEPLFPAYAYADPTTDTDLDEDEEELEDKDDSPNPRRRLRDIEKEEFLATFRQACRDRGWMSRDELLKDVATRLGYGRLGSKIKKSLKGHLRAAIRRRIVAKDGLDIVGQDTKDLSDYSRGELQTVFQSILRPDQVVTRDELYKAVAQYLGFQRLTTKMQAPLKSALNGAIRKGLLGYEGEEVWRQK